MVSCSNLTVLSPFIVLFNCALEPPVNPFPMCKNPTGYVDMTNRNLQRIEKDFLRNSSATCINLSGNTLREVESGALTALTNLHYLNLSGNNLSPEFLTTYEHPTVRVLVLDEAFVKTNLPKDIPNSPTIYVTFPHLKRLYLRRNNFDGLIIPSWELSFPRLTHLHLGDNNLHVTNFLLTVPKALTHLSLSNNRLASFRTGSLEHLNVLILDNNNLSRVCEESAYESCETGVYLNNPINLKKLSLSGNNLSSLKPEELKNLPQLTYLNLANNTLSKIDKFALQHLSNLYRLNLSRNGLRYVPNLCNLRKLKFLDLQYNQLLGQIDHETFCHLPNLDQIDLENNGIPEGPSEVFPAVGARQTSMDGKILKKTRENPVSITNIKK